ncbi:MAG TPA: hypothetical protein VGM88_28520 [Kofleriaceae bacterium]|jgi:hypothetical protein
MRVPSVLVSFVCVLAAACGSVEKLNGDGGGGDDGGSGSDGGSDGGGDTSGGYKSGTRLKYEWYEFNGVKLPYAIYDSQLQFLCQTVATDDTQTAVICVPQSSAQVVYSDASCTTRVAMTPTNTSCPQTAPGYGIDENYDGCTEIVTGVYPVSNTTPTSLASYYTKNTNGTCGLAQDGSEYTFYPLGSATDLASYAKITLPTQAHSGNRLTQELATSPDGFTLPSGFYDSTLMTTCNLNAPWNTADHAQCTPQPQAYDDYYSNSVCTSHVAEYSSSCPGATAPKYAYYYDETQTCPYRDEEFDSITGQGVAASTAYYESGGQCYQTSLGSGSTLYPTDGAVVGVANVPRAPDSTGHTVEQVHMTDGANKYLDFTMYDTTHHTYCYPQVIADGSTHCLNQQYQTQQFYTDAACSASADFVLVYAVPQGCTEVDPPTYAIKYTNQQSCTGNSIEIHQVTQIFSGTLYQNFGTCQPQSFSGNVVYQVGSTLPISEFPAATLSTDP